MRLSQFCTKATALLTLGAISCGAFATAKFQDGSYRARLLTLVKDIAKKTGDQTPVITEALRICGFTIRKEDRTKLFDPIVPTVNIQLAITDYEIKEFWELYKRGQGMTYGNFCNAYDNLIQGNNGPGSMMGTTLTPSLTMDPIQMLIVRKATNLTPREGQNQMLTVFLSDLAQEHEKFTDSHYGSDALLDPIQSLVLTRIVGEEIGKAIKLANPGAELFASLNSAAFDDPGWAEDGFVAGVTGLIGKLVEAKFGEKISKPMDKVNAINSITKFILTYTYLKTEFKMEGDNNLLVRTKDTVAGEKRKMTARTYIDGSRVTDWLKENRKIIAMAGIDVDVPKSGGLAGIETSWEIKGDGKDYDFNNHRVKWAAGQGDMSKRKTDETGVATGTLEGAAQRKALDPKLVKAYEKSISVTVTPQAKSTEVKQDMVDAVTGAIGISGGASGWITPVMETLYRMKWFGSETINVRVRDWKQAHSIGHITVEVKGDGAYYSRDNNVIQHIYRVLEIDNMVMESTDPVGDVPAIPADVLAKLPEAQRKQILDAMKAQAAYAKVKQFALKGPGDVRFTVRDSLYSLTNEIDCENNIVKYHSTDTGEFKLIYPDKSPEGSALMLMLKKDNPTDDQATILVGALLNALHKVERSGKRESAPPDPTVNPVSIFDDCEVSGIDPTNGLKITLKPGVQLPGEEGTGFYGVTSIPFNFGPGNQFKGTIMISISIQNKAPK